MLSHNLVLGYLQTTALPCGYRPYHLLIMSLRLKELLSFPQECTPTLCVHMEAFAGQMGYFLL